MVVVAKRRKTEVTPIKTKVKKKSSVVQPVAKNGSVERPSERAMRETKTKRAKIKASVNGKTPAVREAPTARSYILRVLTKGLAARNEVKRKASALAKKDGADVSFKTFDVGYFITYLKEKKGYKIVDDGERVRAIAP